jgi:preprotein translocase subunit YajC
MVLLQASGISPQIMNLVFIGGMIVVFYFFMIRPQQKKQKDQKLFGDNLQQGDLVITIGGIHGKVVAVEGSAVMMEVDRGVKMKVEKTAISYELSKDLNKKATA